MPASGLITVALRQGVVPTALAGVAMLVAFVVGAALADQSGPSAATALIRNEAPRVLERYRFPDHADLKGDWKSYADQHGAAPIFAWGDFNGDGARDLAFLLSQGIRRRPGDAGRPTVRAGAAPAMASSVCCRSGRGRIVW